MQGIWYLSLWTLYPIAQLVSDEHTLLASWLCPPLLLHPQFPLSFSPRLLL